MREPGRMYYFRFDRNLTATGCLCLSLPVSSRVPNPL
jgi:hypothetical protein